MSNLPLVTIGIPVYNGEKYLRQALESVIAQDYQNLEIIIADNTSTDSTQSICQEFTSLDTRICYYRHPDNLGAIANFNYVLEIARGELFTWLAHDDYFAPTYISKCVDKLNFHDRSIGCCSEIEFVNEDGSLRTGWTQYYRNIDGLNKNVVERVREIYNRVGWYAIYSVFRTDVLRQTSFFQTRYADDVLLLIELSLRGEIIKVPEYLFYYRVPNLDKTPKDFIKVFGLDSNTANEILQGPFTYLAKQVLDTVYASEISIQDKYRIESDFIKTLVYHNKDWLGRIAQEQNWLDEAVTTTNIEKLLEATIVSSKVAKLIKQDPPQIQIKALVFFPHNPFPVSTGAHRRCLEMLAGLRDLGCEIVLFSSNLYSDQAWTQESIDTLKSKYGIETFIYQGTQADLRYLEACQTQSQSGRMNWDYFNTPGMIDSFKQVFSQFKPNLVMVSYSLWGRLVSGKEFESVVKVIDTIDIFSLTMQMFQILTPHFSQQPIDPSAIVPEITNEDFFINLNLQPEQEEYNICDLYDYTIAISQKEGALFAAHTKRTENLYVPMTVDVPQIVNTYAESPLFVISGNCFNLQGATYFIKRVLPLISESVPDFKLRVIGAGGTRLKTTSELDICGFVEDLSSLYTQSGFAICPLIGGTGQQVKIVEAMAHGLPVVALINVAETSPIEHGINGFIANNATEFAEYTILLWNNRQLCQQMGAAARKTMEDKFSSSSVATNFRDIVSIASKVEWKNSQSQIIIDGVFFQLYSTGIARVWKSLLEEWANTKFGNHLVVLDRVGTAPKIEGVSYYQIPAYDYNNTDADREILQQACNELGAEIFISTYYTTPVETPSVFMGYDMIPEVLGFNLSEPMWQEKRKGIEHASAYITISNHTAQDLVKVYPDIDPQNVTIAHCGVQTIFQPATGVEIATFRYKYGINKPYFIIGSSGGYKNTELFLQAFTQLPTKSGFDIIITGGHSLSEANRQYTVGCTVYCLQLDDRELSIAYSGAIALVYPSKYEGFGLPIVEAFASACPVITCRNASIPEVAGDAVIYVSDRDVNEMAAALCEVQKPQLRESLIKLGLERLYQFSWTKMAKIVESVLIEQTLSHLQLNQRNLIIFPDWSADEELLGEELSEIFDRLSQHPDASQITLIIDASSQSDIENANVLISAVVMNLMMNQDLDVTESLTISLTGELSPLQWVELLPKLQGKIKLELESLEVIDLANPQLISEFRLLEILDLTAI